MEDGVAEQLSVNIEKSLTFITEQSLPDGSFIEPGKVWHRDMQVFARFIYLLVNSSGYKLRKCCKANAY